MQGQLPTVAEPTTPSSQRTPARTKSRFSAGIYSRTLQYSASSALGAMRRALRRLDGFRQRRQRVLRRSYIETLRLQPSEHFGPARTVSEKSVDKDDVGALGP